MRLRLGTISTIGALLLAACTSATSPTITTGAPPTSSVVASTTPDSTTSTTAAAPSIATRVESQDVREIGGALPDGTPYVVRFDTPVDPTVEGISAAIILDDESEQPGVIGISSYFPEGAPEPGLDSLNRYTIRSGQGGVTIAIYDEIADGFDDLEAFLDTHIQPGAESKLPNLELSPPLRWAADDEIPLTMEVMYDGFVVRRGCGDLAVACSEAGAVQVIPENVISTPGRGLPAEPVWIESTAPRPVNSPSYVDPGPLSIRGSHDLLWTGDEMIVWGGADGDRLPNLIDGAAFNPDTSTWRMLAPIPLDNATVTRAIWTDDTMIVVSREATFAYDPEADTWSVLGDGLYPPEYPGFLVWTGDVVVAWNSSGIHEFNPGSGEWIQLPDPGFERGLDRWSAALRVVNGEVYALSLAPGYCNGRRIVRWTGTEWTALAPVDLQSTDYADCSYPNQTGVSRDTL